MRERLRAILLLSAAAALSAAACSRDPAPGTPAAAAEGERLMRQMSDTLAKAPVLRFATAETLESPGPPSERRVFRFSRTVTVRRPDALFFEVHGTGDMAIDMAAYYDGKTVSLRDDLRRVWAQTAVPGTLDEMLDDVSRRYAFPVPFADSVYSVPYEAFIGPRTTGGFVGRETIDGVGCAHLSYADDLVGVDVWIPSSGQPLPRRVELAYKRVSGAPKARLDFKSWDLTPRVADPTFRFQPDPAATRIAFEQFVPMELSGGQPTSPASPGLPASGDAASR